MKYGLSLTLLFAFQSLFAQSDAQMLDRIHRSALTQGQCYPWLEHLSNSIGARLSGSDGASKGVAYTKAQLEQLGLDRVYLQEVMVPKWERGEKEVAYVQFGKKRLDLSICALGMSVATPKNGVEAEVIEVKSLDELKALGTENVRGKLVFFNRPMDPEHIETFRAYGGCVDQRSSGAREAGKLGAVGVLVRSMNLRIDDLPHTGMTNYGDTPESQRIPAAAVSTLDANALSEVLQSHPNAKIYFRQTCRYLGEVLSHNVVGEIKGTTFPDKIILVGGHLDSWDLGDGSHDDGAGCVQSMEVLALFKRLGYRPKHTIRAVLFMNEENGVKGGLQYEAESKRLGEEHIFALESDAGGFAPRGFSFEIDAANMEQVQQWKPLFEPYLLHLFRQGHSGVDIGPLQSPKIVKAGLQPDSQRYFDHHHAANDTFDAVNKRELELGAAAMASLVYLFDQYGIR